MKTLTLNISDSIYDELLSLLNTKYPDDISVVDDDIFTQEDETAYIEALEELEKGEAISLEQLNKEINV
ncbi:MAG: hypothetical protein A2X61_06935 [Ignavibacteria bacterium GWB2_35_12]|nr:MAG: hypothetical protein A2X61_06935 [Ignavibacteria bacterium GWB2_35_12]OGU87394.1 MAG: hypothetical protein A2220_01265 [Ignavibacteria bacterium RIFOXYA2_FULL_35_10]OGV22043.1 MAG: hypothetical protein A2475_09435 [Ignavibacteria bacterium RIFOXYC2_FULL_35_21]